MLEPFLDDGLTQLSYSSEIEKSQQVSRRRFLQAIGLAGIGLASLALSPKKVVAQSNSAELWRNRVSGFIYSVCDDRRAKLISAQLSTARIELRHSTSDFHFYYSAPLVFVGMTISPEKVMCGNGFEVNELPYYDVQCPCRMVNDLNAFEIRRVTNVKEIDRFGCVLAPASRRVPLEDTDAVNYRQTVLRYDLNPDDFDVAYKRVFTGRGRAHYGYHIFDKTQVGTNGKRLGDILLSSAGI